MTSNQITTALAKLYEENKHRIVFWDDPAREFVDFVAKLEIAGVRLVHLARESALEIKKRIELDDLEGGVATDVAPTSRETSILTCFRRIGGEKRGICGAECRLGNPILFTVGGWG